jgi:hypothetical protein
MSFPDRKQRFISILSNLRSSGTAASDLSPNRDPQAHKDSSNNKVHRTPQVNDHFPERNFNHGNINQYAPNNIGGRPNNAGFDLAMFESFGEREGSNAKQRGVYVSSNRSDFESSANQGENEFKQPAPLNVMRSPDRPITHSEKTLNINESMVESSMIDSHVVKNEAVNANLSGGGTANSAKKNINDVRFPVDSPSKKKINKALHGFGGQKSDKASNEIAEKILSKDKDEDLEKDITKFDKKKGEINIYIIT